MTGSPLDSAKPTDELLLLPDTRDVEALIALLSVRRGRLSLLLALETRCVEATLLDLLSSVERRGC